MYVYVCARMRFRTTAMAKRIADKELTDRNWDQEEEGEEVRLHYHQQPAEGDVCRVQEEVMMVCDVSCDQPGRDLLRGQSGCVEEPGLQESTAPECGRRGKLMTSSTQRERECRSARLWF